MLAGKAAPIAGWSNHLWTGEPDPETRTTHVVSVGPGGGLQVLALSEPRSLVASSFLLCVTPRLGGAEIPRNAAHLHETCRILFC